MSPANDLRETDDISLRDIFDFLLRFKYLLIAAMFAAGIGAFFQHAQNPRFSTSAVIEVVKSETSPMQALSEKLSGFGTQNSADFIESARLRLVSKALFREAARRILLSPDADKIRVGLNKASTNWWEYIFGSRIDVAYKEAQAQQVLAGLLEEAVGAEITSQETIRIWVKGNSPDVTVAVVNLIAEVGIKDIIENNLRELREAKKFVENRLDTMKKEIEASQDEVINLRKKLGLVTGQGLKDLTLSVTAMRNDLAHAETERLRRINLLGEMKKRFDGGQSDYATLSKFEKLQDELRYWTASTDSLRSMIQKLETSNQGFSNTEQEIANKARDLEFKYKFYGQLKDQLLQIEMMQISVVNKIRAIEAGSRSNTFRSSGGAIYILVASTMAMIFAAIIMYLFESAYPTVRGRKDLSSMPVSFLGEIPDFESKKFRRLTHTLKGTDNFSSHVPIWKHLKEGKIVDTAETMVFKAMRSKVLHLNSSDLKEKDQDGIRVVCVTSARPGEGKTMISGSLASVFSMVKKKTILVDCDLRRSGLTRAFDLESEKGLSNYLHGEEMDWKPLVSTHSQDLDILSAGTQLKDAAELLADDRFVSLIEELKKTYDLIVLDTPPVLSVAETGNIAKTADLVVLNFVQFDTKQEDALHVVEELSFAGIKRIGYVLNRCGHLSKSTYFYSLKAS